MSKKSTIITNLLVIPLMASAIFLASPAFAADPTTTSNTEIRHKTNAPHIKKGIAGTVLSINGDIITVTSKKDVQYTVDASHATIMKASDTPHINPAVVATSDIKVGDAILVRGAITNTEIDARHIFDGKMSVKHLKHERHHFNKDQKNS